MNMQQPDIMKSQLDGSNEWSHQSDKDSSLHKQIHGSSWLLALDTHVM